MNTHTNTYSRIGSIDRRERMLWERRGGWKGGRGCVTIGSPTSSSVGHRGSCRVCSVFLCRKVVQISQQTRKVTDGVSVINPNNRKSLTFVGEDVFSRQCVSWMAKCLDEDTVPCRSSKPRCHGRQPLLYPDGLEAKLYPDGIETVVYPDGLETVDL